MKKNLIKEKYNLKGQVKVVSNIACEYIITSDKDFFESNGTEETKRYFKTAYDFVCQYKDLGEQYILSSKVHMDEETPHMHLVFIPVVHTTDKKGNNVDKIACSEFWKEKDSYRILQDNFYDYMVSHNFNLERGLENGRVHLSVEDYKKITDFEKTKVTIQDIELDLPEVPNIKDFNKLMIGRDEKIQELIIKPKDEIIQKLYEDNRTLNYEIIKQINLVNKAERYEKERKSILSENKELHQKCETIENEYNSKLKEATRKIENKYEDEIYHLEKENNFLRKIIHTFEKTINTFIHWVCNKFSVSSEEDFIREFQEENDTYIDPEKQIEYEEENEEMEW